MPPNKKDTATAATMNHFIWDSSLELRRGQGCSLVLPNICLTTSIIFKIDYGKAGASAGAPGGTAAAGTLGWPTTAARSSGLHNGTVTFPPVFTF